MKVFVTGGAGFIGSHLCKILLDQGHSVTAFDNLILGKEEFLKECKPNPKFHFIKQDLLDLEAVKTAIAGHHLVYHLAANSDISLGGKQTDVDLKLGTLATYNVCEAMRLTGVKDIIFASTSAIYGEATQKPTPESYGPLLPISFYGASKLACEGLLTAFSHNYGFNVWIYRFANIVGNHATHGAPFDFIKKLLAAPAELKVLGNGTQKKSYLHVRDCIRGMMHGYEKFKEPVNLFNLASTGVTEVRFIAEEVIRQILPITKTQAKITFGSGDRGWVGDVAFTWLDGKKLEATGFTARYDSNAAVVIAIEDILKHQELLK